RSAPRPTGWPDRPTRHRSPRPAPEGHDSALARSRVDSRFPRVRPRRQLLAGRRMSGAELVVAFLAGVLLAQLEGIALDDASIAAGGASPGSRAHAADIDHRPS